MGIEAETRHSPSLDAAELRHFEGLPRTGGTSAENFVVSMHSILRGSRSSSRKSRVGVINRTNLSARSAASLFSTSAAEAASCRNRWRGSAGV